MCAVGYSSSEGRYNLTMTCSTAADNQVTNITAADFSFLQGSLTDRSGNGRVATLQGNAHVDMDGATFDGDGDDIRVANFQYAADGTFSVSLWFTKEQCTDNTYEYLYSHQQLSGVGWMSQSYVMMYVGCEENGGGWSTVDGSIIRYNLRDTAGTEATLDISMHENGDFDTITNQWIHSVFAVTPNSMAVFDDGRLVDPWSHGAFEDTGNNAAFPNAGRLRPPLITSADTFDLRTDVFIGGRADSSRARHFFGRIGPVSVYTDAITAAQSAFLFAAGEREIRSMLQVVAARQATLLAVNFLGGNCTTISTHLTY
jgi:hypothetical protein